MCETALYSTKSFYCINTVEKSPGLLWEFVKGKDDCEKCQSLFTVSTLWENAQFYYGT